MTARKGVSVAEAARTIVELGAKCWQKGWVAANDGNISWRIGDDAVVCTPTGVSKGMLTAAAICVVDMDGRLRRGGGGSKPSSEMKMHLKLYRERDDIRGVFHAHPPYATAHAVTGTALAECVLPEIVLGLGSIPLVPYGTPSTEEIPERLAPFVKEYDAWLLQNHGALTAGKDPYQAYFRMESLELYAQVLCIARGIGKVAELGREQVAALAALRKNYGIPEKDNIVFPGGEGKPGRRP